MRIGDLSRRTGVSVRMLRHYEREGLLHPARTASGYRSFGAEDRDAVERIKLLNGAGLPLAAIGGLLACLPDGGGGPPCAALAARMTERLGVIDARIDHLQQAGALMRAILAGEALTDCPGRPNGPATD